MANKYSRIALAALVAGAALFSPRNANATDFFNFKTGEASLEQVLNDYKTGKFDVYLAGTKDNPGAVLLDRKGGYDFDVKASGSSHLVTLTYEELEKMLKHVDDPYNSGAVTGINPDDGKVESYVAPRPVLYEFPAQVDGKEKTFKFSVLGGGSGGGIIDSGGGGSGSGAGAGGGAGGGGGGAGGGVCLLNGSLVLTEKNEFKQIQNLNVDDEVLSLDVKTNELVKTKVTKVLKNHPRGFYYVINGNLKITNDHPTLTLRDGFLKWVRVENLQIEDMIKSAEGFVTVQSKEKIDEPALTVYVETESGSFIAKAGENFYVLKANYAPANKQFHEPIIIGT